MDEKKSQLHPETSRMASSSLSLASRMRQRTRASKKLITGLILLAVAILAMGLIYFYWYQNPQKVISDALMHAISAKSLTYTGTINTKSNPSMDISIDGGTSEKGGTLAAKLAIGGQNRKYTLEGNAIINDRGNLYFKVKNIDDLATNYRKAIPAESLPLFDNIITTVNDKWIMVSSQDLQDYSQNLARAKTCISDISKKVQTDSAVKAQLAKAYEAHPFITIDEKLGAQGGSLGYKLAYDPEVVKGFTKEYKTTAIYKTLAGCDPSFAIKGDSLFNQNTTSVNPPQTTVWIDQWTHHLTKVTVQDTGRVAKPTTVNIEPIFNQTVTVETPKDTTTLERLQQDVQRLLQSTQKPSPPPAR